MESLKPLILFLTICNNMFKPTSGYPTKQYQETPMEDPLQPVWEKLHQITLEIVGGFKTELNNKHTDLNTDLERHFVKMSDNLWSKIADMYNHVGRDLDEMGSVVDRVDGQVMREVREFYDMEVKNMTATQLSSLEQNISSKISSLADKVSSIVSGIQLSTVSGSSSSVNPDGGGSERGSREEACVAKSDDISAEKIAALVNASVTSLMAPLLNTQMDFMKKQNILWSQLSSTLEEIREKPTFLPRDCSDHHWHQPHAPSGVYQIFPTLDPKIPVTVMCDMKDNASAFGGDNNQLSNGGWTEVLRRHNSSWGLTNFNRTWREYAQGFGIPGQGEHWLGLRWLHALTYRQPYEAEILMHDIVLGTFLATYSTFRVEDESRQFRLVVGGFGGNLTKDSLGHSQPFSAPINQPISTLANHLNDRSLECAQINKGGWWYTNSGDCEQTTLTGPFPTTDDRNAKTIRWLNKATWMILDDVRFRIRPAAYGQAFDRSTPKTDRDNDSTNDLP